MKAYSRRIITMADKPVFNKDAARDVYEKAGTAPSAFTVLRAMTLRGEFSEKARMETATNMAIIGSDAQTNLEAIYAGYKGTSAEKSVGTFKDVILSHDDLKKGANAMLKDEGSKMLGAFEKMLTGDGALNVDEFKTMMNDPAKRKLVASMMTAVGTDKYTAEDAVEFTSRFVSAARDPKDLGKGKKFLEFAKNMGLDTSEVEKQAMKDGMKSLFSDIFSSDPKKSQGAIAGFVNSMRLPPEMANIFTSILSGLAGGLQNMMGYYANGKGSQPGFVQIIGNAMDIASKDGAEIRQRHGFSTPPAPGGG